MARRWHISILAEAAVKDGYCPLGIRAAASREPSCTFMWTKSRLDVFPSEQGRVCELSDMWCESATVGAHPALLVRHSMIFMVQHLAADVRRANGGLLALFTVAGCFYRSRFQWCRHKTKPDEPERHTFNRRTNAHISAIVWQFWVVPEKTPKHFRLWFFFILGSYWTKPTGNIMQVPKPPLSRIKKQNHDGNAHQQWEQTFF